MSLKYRPDIGVRQSWGQSDTIFGSELDLEVTGKWWETSFLFTYLGEQVENPKWATGVVSKGTCRQPPVSPTNLHLPTLALISFDLHLLFLHRQGSRVISFLSTADVTEACAMFSSRQLLVAEVSKHSG